MPVACEIVTALQTHLTRTVNPFHPAVLTVARIAGGTTNNVIPESVELEGTLRTVDEATRAGLHDSVARVATKIAEAHGCRAEVNWTMGYPVTVNEAGFTEFAFDVMRDLVGAAQVYEMPAPAMGAEDFSYVLQRVPGAMAFLGVCPPGEEFHTAEGCHSNRMRMDEEPMAIGIATHAAVALSYLS
jgi:hippurate hydrolase